MKRLLVVENTRRWRFVVPGAEIVSARDYLVDPRYSSLRRATVFNFCRTYGYQSTGYYVSLLAAARGHRPLPAVETLQDLRLSSVVRVVAEELDDRIQRNLAGLRSDRFELSIYFGRNLAKRYDRLARDLFNQFPAPFLRASFVREQRWKLQGLRPIATGEIPESHDEFVVEQAQRWLWRPAPTGSRRAEHRYDLAILRNADEVDSPSAEPAIRRFVKAAQGLGIEATVIGAEDAARIAEFDALFIRETTSVNHHTYRLARRAEAEGLVVIDDPQSIVRCTNKVYQAELFARHGVPSPQTVVVDAQSAERVIDQIGLPCVLKRPDSSFSRGVVRVEDEASFQKELALMLDESELVVAQAFARSEFDWRVGVLGGRALWVCKYHMARGHWQIIAHAGEGAGRSGKVETFALDDAPPRLIEVAERCAGLIGDGLYGVDLKEVDDHFLVMEVNDNPNIDVGYEDRVLGKELYERVMLYFLERLDARGGGARP